MFFALDPKQYENLVKNQAEVLRWVWEAADQLKRCQGPGE